MAGEEDKTFLSRWAARKAAVRAADEQEKSERDKALAKPEAEAEPALDLQALPSIDDLGIDSDYTAFFRKGVPDELRKAAMRKLWVTEPSVVNYRPLVEYAWHDNEPGFGPLLPTDNVEELLSRIFNGTPVAEAPAADPAGAATAPEQPVTLPPALPQPESGTDVTPVASKADVPDTETAAPRRRHGGALPS